MRQRAHPDLTGLAVGFTVSAAEQVAARVAAQAPTARVVAAIPPFAEVLANGQGEIAGQRPSVFICGDDGPAKTQIAQLVSDLGAEPVDAGALPTARLVEPAMMLLVSLAYGGGRPRVLGLKLLEN